MPKGAFVLFLASAAVVGFTAGRVTAPAPPPCPEPPPCPACPTCPEPAPEPQPAVTEQLAQAEASVVRLQEQVAAKEKELKAIRATAAKAADRSDANVARARALEAELTALKAQLTAAEIERDRLTEELRVTRVQLDDQVRATASAQEEARAWAGKATDQGWARFVAESKVKVCEKGTAKKHEACAEAVDEALTPELRRRFTACVSSGQAEPVLSERSKDQKLPAFAVALPEDKRLGGRDWYVTLCDPTLPEARTRDAVPRPPAAVPTEPTPAPGAARDALDDLPDEAP